MRSAVAAEPVHIAVDIRSLQRVCAPYRRSTPMEDINDDEPEVTWDDVKPGSPAYQKGMVAAEECDALRHLAWPRDLRDMQHAMGLFKKPETYDDYRYAFHLLGEVAERLREARDFPEKRILRRWQ